MILDNYISIAGLVLVLIIVLGIVAFLKYKKDGCLKQDYKAMFIIGISWVSLGIVFYSTYQNISFLLMGLVFTGVGLANKDKWGKEVEQCDNGAKNKICLLTGVLLLFFVAGVFGYIETRSNNSEVIGVDGVLNFQDCINAGNPAMESYPRQCRNGSETFTENIGNEVEKMELIRLDNPRPNQDISSPLTIEGEAKGNWFFEGDAPVVLTNWDGLIIAEGYITAKKNAMTEDFVPFEGVLTFSKPDYKNNGILILRKDNPSNNPSLDDALEIPIMFK